MNDERMDYADLGDDFATGTELEWDELEDGDTAVEMTQLIARVQAARMCA